jgi:hypothetical protein
MSQNDCLFHESVDSARDGSYNNSIEIHNFPVKRLSNAYSENERNNSVVDIDKNMLDRLNYNEIVRSNEGSSYIDQILIPHKILLDRYKQRKLRILVANDNQFQLFLIAKSLLNLNFIEKIDKARNG